MLDPGIRADGFLRFIGAPATFALNEKEGDQEDQREKDQESLHLHKFKPKHRTNNTSENNQLLVTRSNRFLVKRFSPGQYPGQSFSLHLVRSQLIRSENQKRRSLDGAN